MPRAVQPQSFFETPPADPGTERFDVLLHTREITLERIVSSGGQPRQRFCQANDEWVMLLRGNAEMLIDGSPVHLEQGQFVFLPRHTPHEVVATSSNALWLAVHVHTRGPASSPDGSLDSR